MFLFIVKIWAEVRFVIFTEKSPILTTMINLTKPQVSCAELNP